MLSEFVGVLVVFSISFVLLAIGYIITGRQKLKRGCATDPDGCNFCEVSTSDCAVKNEVAKAGGA